jgi:hypothetical protein
MSDLDKPHTGTSPQSLTNTQRRYKETPKNAVWVYNARQQLKETPIKEVNGKANINHSKPKINRQLLSHITMHPIFFFGLFSFSRIPALDRGRW